MVVGSWVVMVWCW